MQGKIALEEHFAVADTLSDSLPFVPPDEKIGRSNARRLFKLQ
jgi:hypothetical protein